MKILKHWLSCSILVLAPLAQANEKKHEVQHESPAPQVEKGEHSAPSKDNETHKGEGTAGKVKSSAEKLNEKVSCEKLPQKTEADLWNLSECFHKIGVVNTTVEILKTISQRNPKDLEAYFTASWLLWQEGRNQGGADERKRTQEAMAELERARLSNPSHWEVDTEIGDFYFLRLNQPELAYPEYIRARKHYDGDYARNVPKAEAGRKASIENRIARTAEKIDRKGEAVEASCRALFFDPDDAGATQRLDRMKGSCTRKNVQDPRKDGEEESSQTEEPKGD